MVKKQVGLENSASLVVSQQSEQQPDQQQKQQQQQQHQHHHQQHHHHHQHQGQPEQAQRIDIDIDLTPEEPKNDYNYARQANAIYAPLRSANSTSHESELPPHKLQMQHAHLATTPYNLNTVSPQNTVSMAVAVSSVPLSIMPTEIPAEDEERLERIFNQLDRDGDGKIDIHDLSAALHEFGMSSVYAVVSEGPILWVSIYLFNRELLLKRGLRHIICINYSLTKQNTFLNKPNVNFSVVCHNNLICAHLVVCLAVKRQDM